MPLFLPISSSTKEIVVLSLGSQTIRLGVFAEEEAELVLLRVGSYPILADPADGAVRYAQVKVGIENLMEKLEVKRQKVFYTYSSEVTQSDFFPVTTSVGEGDERGWVASEMPRRLADKVDELNWAYLKAGRVPEGEEVAFFSVRKETALEVYDVITRAGMQVGGGNAGAISLLYGFYNAYPDCREGVVILDLGAKSTDLIFVNGEHFFIRSLNKGSNAITSAIASLYRIDFAEAEQYKVEVGRVPGKWSKEEDAYGELSELVDKELHSLTEEIQRTLRFYERSRTKVMPSRVLLAGCGAQLQYFDVALSEILDIPVEFFDSLRSVRYGPQVEEERVKKEAHVLGELVGLAAQVRKHDGVVAEFVSDPIVRDRLLYAQRYYYYAAGALLVIGTLIWALVLDHHYLEEQEELEELRHYQTSLRQPMNRLVSLAEKREQLNVAVAQYSSLVEQRYRVVLLLEGLRKQLSSEYIWIESIADLVDYEVGAQEEIPYITPEYEVVNYGESMLFVGRGAKRNKSSWINAVQVKGYWRENKSGASVVYSALHEMRKADGSPFSFFRKGRELEDYDLLKLQNSIPEGEVKASFVLNLFLSKPVRLR